MKLRKDTVAGENMSAMLVILGSVFVIGSLVIVSMMPLFTSGQGEQSGVEPLAIFGAVTIGAYWTPTLIDGGYDITWADAYDDPSTIDSGDMLDFTYAGASPDTIYTGSVRNSTDYLDGWCFGQYNFIHFRAGSSNVYVSYNAIENATQYDTDGAVYAIVYPGGWSINDTTALIVEFDDDASEDDVNEALWSDNEFTIYIAWVTSASEDGSLTWYNVAWRVATFQYELTGTAFDKIFSAIFDMIILTTVIVVAARILHGG